MQRSVLFLFGCNLAGALPVHLPAFGHQLPLLSSVLPHTAQRSTQHLDRIPRSAELLFTASDDDEIVHVWLPLGQRIYTRDYPVLPLYPTSARITNVLGLSPEVTARHKQQQVTCVIVAGSDASQRKPVRESRGTKQARTEVVVSFQEGDGVVGLDGPSSMWSFEGREVESYECF